MKSPKNNQNVMNIILASQSPRRKELLSRLQYAFDVCTCDIDESVHAAETPTAYIMRMVDSKADTFITHTLTTLDQQLIKNNCNNRTLVLTADTIGVMPNSHDILVKPIDKSDAFRMWQIMSGDTHCVWTAVKATLINNNLQTIWEDTIIEKTEVSFIPLRLADMEKYWQTGEPIDKAGAYAIQGLAAAWVTSIHGSYTNVVGLPLAQVKCLIDSAQSCLL